MTMPPSSAPPSDVALLKRGQSCPTALGTTRSPTSGASPDPPVGTGRGVGGDGGSSAVDTQSKARRGSDNGTEADIVPRTRRRSASTSAGSGTGSMPPNRPASRSGSNFSDEQCSPTLARAMIDDEVAGIDVGGDEDSVLSVLRTSPATRTPDGVQRIVDEMERFSSFAAKPESLRRRVCALMEFSAFSRGDMVCTGSDVLDFWWFVLAGTVQVAASAEVPYMHACMPLFTTSQSVCTHLLTTVDNCMYASGHDCGNCMYLSLHDCMHASVHNCAKCMHASTHCSLSDDTVVCSV